MFWRFPIPLNLMSTACTRPQSLYGQRRVVVVLHVCLLVVLVGCCRKETVPYWRRAVYITCARVTRRKHTHINTSTHRRMCTAVRQEHPNLTEAYMYSSYSVLSTTCATEGWLKQASQGRLPIHLHFRGNHQPTY